MNAVLPPKSRDEYIWDIYSAHGGALSVERLTELCSPEIFQVTDQKAIISSRRKIVHDAINSKLKNGLPRAIQTKEVDKDGCKVWKAEPLWTFEDVHHAFLVRLSGMKDDYEPLKALYEYALNRYAKALPLPDITWH